MPEIKVSSAALRSSASVLLGQGGQYNGLVGDIRGSMNTMKSQWMGSAADTFIAKFNALQKNFDAYFRTIQDYGNFLNKAATDYETAERQVTADSNVVSGLGNSMHA